MDRPRKRVARLRAGRRPTRAALRESRAVPPPPRRLHNLPIQLTTFIGREPEIAEVKHLLGTTRLLTLAGSGGCGKSRLALQVATECLERYPDGVWLVDLAPLADPAFVPNSVAVAIDVPEQPTRPLTDTLADSVRAKTLLLILDNCEHLRTACQSLADRLLRAADNVRILATSRQALRVEGESTYRVPPLRLPDVRQAPPVARLGEYDAVRLFADRAALSQPGFGVTARNAPAIVQICHRLDGMPLAIEFAAARVGALTVEQIAERLDDQFWLLTTGSMKTVPRHQTLRATLDWSHSLLTQQEQTLFRRLSVFAGGFTLEAAEQICAGEAIGDREILDLLTRLVDKSLVVFNEREGQARYRLLESVRQYGRDHLQEAGETDDIRRQHRDWYLALAERAQPEFRGPREELWLERLETEHNNLRAALAWSAAETDGAETSLRLAGALVWLWFQHGHWTEGRRWLERVLPRSHEAPLSILPRAFQGATLLAVRQGDYARALALGEQGVSLCRAVGDRENQVYLLLWLGSVRMRQGDLGRAAALVEEGMNLSNALGSKGLKRLALMHMADLARFQGDYERAVAYHMECLTLANDEGMRTGIAYCLQYLGMDTLRQRRYRRAAKYFRDGLSLSRDVGNRWAPVENLMGLAGVACARQHHERAARLFGAAEALRETLDLRPYPLDQAYYDQCIDSTHAALGNARYEAAWAEGRAMTLEQAIEEALAVADAPHTPKETKARALTARVDLLTSREREVATLIAQGRTNREIASELQVMERTAETHVSNIFNKLKVNSRTQIAVWAIAHGLHTPDPRS